MKTSYLHSVIMLALLVAMPMSAATFQWAYVIGTSATPIEVYVDQVVADGSGGCVVVWNERNNDTVHTRVFLLRPCCLIEKGTRNSIIAIGGVQAHANLCLWCEADAEWSRAATSSGEASAMNVC